MRMRDPVPVAPVLTTCTPAKRPVSNWLNVIAGRSEISDATLKRVSLCGWADRSESGLKRFELVLSADAWACACAVASFNAVKLAPNTPIETTSLVVRWVRAQDERANAMCVANDANVRICKVDGGGEPGISNSGPDLANAINYARNFRTAIGAYLHGQERKRNISHLTPACENRPHLEWRKGGRLCN